jgi:hypothetical protein
VTSKDGDQCRQWTGSHFEFGKNSGAFSVTGLTRQAATEPSKSACTAPTR